MENPPSSPKQPDAKKLKMSSTTTSDDDDCAAAAAAATTTATGVEPTSQKKQRYKRRKIAIFFAYCGVGYQGMQKNPGAKTIEADLEEALYLSGAVPEQDRGQSKRFDWARSARTDKGVSAVGQVVSGRFYVDPPGLVDRLNANLPNQIRVFGYKRVTPSFSAKKFCDRRRYVYLIPVFALDPSAHRDRESVLSSMGSENELAKCVECSERGRKVVGVMGKRSFKVVAETGISSNNGDAILNSEVKEENKVSLDNGDSLHCESIHEVNVIKSNEDAVSETDSAAIANVATRSESHVVLHSEAMVGEDLINGKPDLCNNGVEDPVKGSGSAFCYGEKERERFNRTLKYYVGTHNFHNFTTRTKAEDPSAQRFIVSFNANTTVTVDGFEFVKCEVVGQSFMLHQIRKMIGLAVAVMRNCAPESLIETALQKDVNINVPTAPEVGLYLDECFFTSYNKKWEDSHEELSMKAYEEEVEEFKTKHVYSHIASTEHNEGVVGLWLHSLNHRNYPDLQVRNHEVMDDRNSAGNGENN